MSGELAKLLSDLKEPEALAFVEKALGDGVDPMELLGDAKEGMIIVGERFASEEYFIPDLVFSGEILKGVVKMLEPHLKAKEGEEDHRGEGNRSPDQGCLVCHHALPPPSMPTVVGRRVFAIELPKTPRWFDAPPRGGPVWPGFVESILRGPPQAGIRTGSFPGGLIIGSSGERRGRTWKRRRRGIRLAEGGAGGHAAPLGGTPPGSYDSRRLEAR